MAQASLWRVVGPGLLFSGVAIGVSHLVQATKAGAMYGMALAGFIILVTILKYPTFRFGVDYGHAARKSLLAGYGELGRWAPVLFCLVILPFLPVIQGVGSTTAAGLLGAVTGLDLTLTGLLVIVLAITAALLVFGGLPWLDMVNRILLAFLIVATLATTAMVLPDVQWGTVSDFAWATDPTVFLFLIALAGFMPNPLDISVPQSIWTVQSERAMPAEERPDLAGARLGFVTGYVLTAVLAICFCIIGAGVMHSGGVAPADGAVDFATQVIALYGTTLGEGPAFLAGIAALAVIFSTVLVGYDAYTRTLTAAYGQIFGKDDPAHLERVRRGVVIGLLLAVFAAVTLLLESFATFVNLGTSLAFIAGPVVAVLNHLVITRCDLPEEARPSAGMRGLSIVAIVVMCCLAITFLMIKLELLAVA